MADICVQVVHIGAATMQKQKIWVFLDPLVLFGVIVRLEGYASTRIGRQKFANENSY